MAMEVVDGKKPKISFHIKKKPLAAIVSMVLDRSIGFYIVDQDGNEIEIGDNYWHIEEE